MNFLNTDAAMNWQNALTWLELAITFISTGISIAVWLRTKRIEKKLFTGVDYNKLDYSDRHAALVCCLNGSPDKIIGDVIKYLGSDSELTKDLLTSDPLVDCEGINYEFSGFRVCYAYDTLNKNKGRLVLLSGAAMPTDKDEELLQTYISNYISIMQHTVNEMARRGVQKISLFMNVPLPLASIIGISVKNRISVDLYHHQIGYGYYKVANSSNVEHALMTYQSE